MTISAFLSFSGYTDIGYRFYNPDESPNGTRLTAGVVDAGDGWYSVANATIPAGVASVRWNSLANVNVLAREYFFDRSELSLSAAGVQAIWNALTSALTVNGSVGKLVASSLPVTSIAGSVGAVTNPVTVGTNNDKTGYTLSGPVTVGTNNDKTGYTLAGPVTIGTNNDKTGYSLSSAQVMQLADEVLKHDWTQVTGEATSSLLQALRSIRNKWTLGLDGVLTVYREDGVTIAWQRNVTTDQSALPITGMS